MSFVDISPIEYPLPSVFLTMDELSEFGLKPGDWVTVTAGSATANAIVNTSQPGNYVSYELLSVLGLPKVRQLRIKSAGPAELRIGPLIGIMISKSNKYKLPPFTSQRNLLNGFLDYGNFEKTMTYVFSPGDVDTSAERVRGHFLECDTAGKYRWNAHTFPLPDIVYDRILFRTYERKKSTQEISSFFLNHDSVKYFNPKFLNKWETYLILRENPELQAHIPETRKYDGPDNLIDFLNIHQTVYLKPDNGSLGKGIVRISNTAEGCHFQYRSGKKLVSGHWNNFAEFSAGLKKLVAKRTYIMQQGLDLLKFNSKVFDIRVLLQKNEFGSWINTATVARIAPAGGIFPNVAAGGQPKNIQSLWHELLSEDWNSSQTCSMVGKISLAAADTLEQSLGTFGEIGLDIGIDINGTAWIIEINSKPSRSVFPPDQPNLKKMSLKLPINFATFLAGFTQTKEELTFE